MKIAQIAPLDNKVPPVKYGGTELIVSHLTEGLVKRGHKVTLFASGDSRTSARLISVCDVNLVKDGGKKFNPLAAHLLLIQKVLDHADEFDIIHNHLNWRFLPFTPFIKTPVVHTYHASFHRPRIRPIFLRFKDQNFISISRNQAKGLPQLNFVGNVYNGVSVEDFPFGDGKGDYLVCLGRISSLKGTHLAAQVAHKTSKKLFILGDVAGWEKTDQNYFEKKVKPLVDGRSVVHVGEVSFTQKVSYLKKASALLFPIQWEEPFGLVMIEAMACGTPVIAFRKGSVSEVVVDGKTGFVVDSVDKMIKAVHKVDQIDRNACRERVEKNFTVEKMVAGYEEVYQQILKR